MSHYQSMDFSQCHEHCSPQHCSHLLHDSAPNQPHHLRPNKSSQQPNAPSNNNQSNDQSSKHFSLSSTGQLVDQSDDECESDIGDIIPIGREVAVVDIEPDGVNVFHEMFAGSVAACVARFVIAPFDVIKIRFQIQETPHSQSINQPVQQPKYHSVYQAFRTIAREEGVRAFWKGNLAAELMVVPYGAVSFLAYQQCKHVMEKFVIKNVDHSVDHSINQSSSSVNPSISARNHHLVNICSGSFAGCCATLATYPLDLMRTRFAAQQEPKLYKSLASAFLLVFSTEGVRGLYAGMWPTLCGIVPLMAIQFGCYEGMKTGIERMRARQCRERMIEQSTHHSINQSNQHFDSVEDSSSVTLPTSQSTTHNSIKIWEQTICGFSAGVVSKFLTMPFDVIKKRFQVSGFDWDATSRSRHTTNNHTSSNPVINQSKEQANKQASKQASSRRFVAGHRPFTGVLDCFRGIVRHEGWRGLFKGTVPSTLKAGPNSAIIYVVYEQTMNLLQDFDQKHKQPIKKAQH